MKSQGNPKDPTQRLRDAPKCCATSKRTGGRCKAPAVRGWRVCRMHGAGGGQPAGKEHPNYRHGLRTKQMEEVRRLASFLSKEARDMG